MSLTSPFSPIGGGGGGQSVFGGQTVFGFAVPQGDSGRLAAQGEHCSMSAVGIGEVRAGLGRGMSTVAGDWSGMAHSAFMSYTEHAVRILNGSEQALTDAGSAFTRLSELLSRAQAAARAAAADCEEFQGRQQAAEAEQAAHTAHAQQLESEAMLAPHPAAHAAAIAQSRAVYAQADEAGRAAQAASGELDYAIARGKRIEADYEIEAEALARQIQSAADQLQLVPVLADGVPMPVPITAQNVQAASRVLASRSLRTVGSALTHPAELRRLLGRGELTPGAVAALGYGFTKESERLLADRRAAAAHGGGGGPSWSSLAQMMAATDAFGGGPEDPVGDVVTGGEGIIGGLANLLLGGGADAAGGLSVGSTGAAILGTGAAGAALAGAAGLNVLINYAHQHPITIFYAGDGDGGGQGGDPAERRVKLRVGTKQAVEDQAPKTPEGDFQDPNTGEPVPKDGPFDYGHKPGLEWRRTQQLARSEGWSRKQVIEYENNPDHYQIEDPGSNRSHVHEAP